MNDINEFFKAATPFFTALTTLIVTIVAIWQRRNNADTTVVKETTAAIKTNSDANRQDIAAIKESL